MMRRKDTTNDNYAKRETEGNNGAKERYRELLWCKKGTGNNYGGKGYMKETSVVQSISPSGVSIDLAAPPQCSLGS